MELKRPGIGLSTIILNNKQEILISKRLKDNNEWATPGGHLERFETLEECSSRELFEETNIEINPKNFHFLFFKNIIKKDKDYHYLDFFLVAKLPENQKIINCEPDKHSDWEWVSFEDLLQEKHLFVGLEELKKEMKSNDEFKKRISFLF